ncbi:hypothetical protein RDABS01_022866 [Bienertia sinuspersici]
MYDFSYHPS